MEYKGIKIEVRDTGMFAAEIGHDSIQSETLKGCKKQIDSVLMPKVRVKAFYCDRWSRGYEDPQLLEEVEITSRATEDGYFWLVSIETKTRRKARSQDLLKYNKEDADRIYSLNQSIKKNLDEIEKMKDKQKYTDEELYKLLRGE